jgi:hypothetical protein
MVIDPNLAELEAPDPYLLEREGWLIELGFDCEQAGALASARDGAGQLVEVHAIRNALERGCDHATAFAIYA